MTVPTIVITLEEGTITSIDVSHQARVIVVDHDARENGLARHTVDRERVLLTEAEYMPDETGFVERVKAAL